MTGERSAQAKLVMTLWVRGNIDESVLHSCLAAVTARRIGRDACAPVSINVCGLDCGTKQRVREFILEMLSCRFVPDEPPVRTAVLRFDDMTRLAVIAMADDRPWPGLCRELAMSWAGRTEWVDDSTADPPWAIPLPGEQGMMIGPASLPFDRAGSVEPGPLVERRTARLPVDCAARIRELAREHGSDIRTLTRAVGAAFLARMSGRTDAAAGIEIDGVQFGLDVADEGLTAIARRLEAGRFSTVAAAQRKLPAVITGMAAEERETSDGVMFCTGDMYAMARPRPFSVLFGERNDQCWFEYSPCVLDDETVDRWLGYFATFLHAALESPGTPVRALPLLSESERKRIVVSFNDTACQCPQGCIHEHISARARSEPDAIAIATDHITISYGELDARSDRMSHSLRQAGVGPGSLAGIMLDRSPQWVVAILAVLKSGAAYLPLDPTYPVGRIEYMLTDSGAQTVITTRDLAGRLPPGSVLWLIDGVHTSSADVSPAVVDPDAPAYVIYTSGSTGRPKGVVVGHRGICNLAQAQFGALGVGAGSFVLQFASPSFDAMVWEIFPTLYAGATLCVAPASDLLPGPALAGTCARLGITMVTLPPSALAVMSPADLEGVTTLVSAGESLSASLAAHWAAGRRLYNAYGPTEATVCATMTELDGTGPVTIGRPLPNCRVHILDERLEPVPVGFPGELYIGGTGLAHGYLNRPELTAERFVPDPFHPGERLYRTGDIARYRPRGDIDFVGRADHLVKLRGYRIELGEIEAMLSSHAAVADAVVMVRSDIGDGLLTAYVLARSGARPDPGELNTHLRNHLPAYMVPAAVVVLDRFPLTAAGKVDRQALPAPDRSAFTVRESSEAHGGTQAAIARIWAELLGTEPGVDDDFFALGGHSLGATRLVSRIRAELGAELPLSAVFSTPTIRGQAELIERQNAAGKPVEFPPITPVSRERELPLSYSQERVWFVSRLEPDNIAYNSQAAIRLRGSLDVSALRRALTEIVRRHEIFRTAFPAIDGRPVQDIQLPAPIELPVIDLSGLAGNQQAAELDRLVRIEVNRPFDLLRPPLVRWLLYRLGHENHLLLHVEHHLVHDGWSFNVFLSELAALYRAYITPANDRSPLPEPKLQFADFACWQRDWMTGEAAGFQLDYWRRQLSGAAILELPSDRPRPPMQTFCGRCLVAELDPELSDRIREFGRTHGVTLFMTMLAAFNILLQRWSGQHDIVVGSGIANRRRPEAESLIGMIINNVVLRTDLSGNPDVTGLLSRVRTVALQAYACQDIPFDAVVQAVGPPRDLSRNPLFQVGFSFHDAPLPGLDLPGLTVELCETLSNDSAKFDLNVIAIPRSEQLVGSGGGSERAIVVMWEYNSDLFDEDTVRRMTGHYRTLLQAMLADPFASIDSLPMLTQAEQDQLTAWNDTAADYPADVCLHELVSDHARANPDAIAVVAGERRLTYGELEARATALAGGLRHAGVRQGVYAGLLTARSTETIIGMLGIMKAGGAYVPFDPEHPPERLEYMVEDCRAAVIVTGGHCPAFAPGIPRIQIDGDEPGVQDITPPSPGDPAYVIYTSGTTGRPKGVACTHRGVVNLLSDMRRRCPLRGGARHSLWTNFSFDVSVYEIFSALTSGGELHLTNDALRADPARFIDWLAEHRIESAYVPPFMIRELYDWTRVNGSSSSLSRLLVGVEPIPARLLAGISRHVPGLRVFNGYGPAEATVYATVHAVDPESIDDGNAPIGKPVQNMSIHILDQRMRPVPVGVFGEIHIGGIGVATGYINRPDPTARKFVPHPSAATNAGRLYRTGDIARWRPDGEIEFSGRIDSQVKIRGFRVELGEIESVLCEHDQISHAVVMVTGDGSDQTLTAYITPTGEILPPAADLRDFLARRLPRHMIPAAFLWLNAIPVTAHGKVDRQALAEMKAAGHAAKEFTAPRDPLEELVAAAWSRVLGHQPIGAFDHFFDLGGHSLLAMRITSLLRELTGVDLPLGAVFECQTVAALASRIRAGDKGEKPGPIAHTAGDQPVASPQQGQLWFLQQLEPGNPFYNIVDCVHLAGPLDEKLLEQCINAVAARHEPLRTSFAPAGGGPVQVIHPLTGTGTTTHIPLTIIDVKPDPSEPLAPAISLARELGRDPFDLGTAPLIRAFILRLSPSERVFVLVIHHIISDAWSMRILHREIAELYAAATSNRPPSLPALAVSYADCARWQSDRLSTDGMADAFAYWRTRLDGCPPPLRLPHSGPRPSSQTYAGDVVHERIPDHLRRAMNELARQQGVTLYMVMLTGFKVLLHTLTGSTDFVVGSPFSNRSREETTHLIGYFVNAAPLRTAMNGNPPVSELLRRVRETVLGAHAHQDAPLDRLVEQLNITRDPSTPPVFQVMFTFQDPARRPGRLGGAACRPLLVHNGTCKFDLNLSIATGEQEAAAWLEFNRDLFDAGVASEMVKQYLAVLEAITAQPDSRLSALRGQLCEQTQTDEELDCLFERGDDVGQLPVPR